jgi:hypothetical protein
MTYTAIREINGPQSPVLIDLDTGTILNNRVVAVPGDVFAENEEGLDGVSDSTIIEFAKRYGFPLYVFVMDGE